MWTQGPSLLQSLRMLEGIDIADDGPERARISCIPVTETMKLAFADREAYYGDPAAHRDPGRDAAVARLCRRAPRADRRDRVAGPAPRPDRRASRPGPRPRSRARSQDSRTGPGVGAGEPTMAHLTEKRGDTVHIDVIDRWGNMVSATPSGGWLQSSPVVPGLGMPLNTRAQMFWLDEGLPTSLAPGRRPRTTLSPSMAARRTGRRPGLRHTRRRPAGPVAADLLPAAGAWRA